MLHAHPTFEGICLIYIYHSCAATSWTLQGLKTYTVPNTPSKASYDFGIMPWHVGQIVQHLINSAHSTWIRMQQGKE